jgi:hypothetical protein
MEWRYNDFVMYRRQADGHYPSERSEAVAWDSACVVKWRSTRHPFIFLCSIYSDIFEKSYLQIRNRRFDYLKSVFL